MSRETDSADALRDPQAGDYWHEMFCPILLVVERNSTHVAIIDKRVTTRDNHWGWDHEAKPKILSLTRFRSMLSYGSEAMKHRTWCDALRKCHLTYVDYFQSKLFQTTEQGEK